VSSPGVIYFARSGAYLKVGWTKSNARYRVSLLQVGNPEEIALVATAPGTLAQEKAIHRALKGAKVRREWFREAAPEVQRLLRLVLGGGEFWEQFEFEFAQSRAAASVSKRQRRSAHAAPKVGLIVGRNVLRLRNAAGLSRAEVSDAANISRCHIGFIERGQRPNMSVKTIGAIARVLGVSLDELMREAA
jgi:DNA-binding XRE family transcriptional regulator